jgi:hypothetical protein
LIRSPEHRAAARRRTCSSFWTLKLHAKGSWEHQVRPQNSSSSPNAHALKLAVLNVTLNMAISRENANFRKKRINRNS